MKIIWHGSSTFHIESQKTVLHLDASKIDGTAGCVYVFSSEQTKSKGTTRIFDWPGEYESGGIGWISTSIEKNNGDECLIANFDIEGIKVCHLGSIDRELNEDDFQKIGEVDVLLVPLGGNDSLTPKKAAHIVEKIEPRVVIPMLFGDDQIDEFCKEVGLNERETRVSYNTTRNQLPSEEMQFIILEAQA